jgi:hypothetical protein
LEVAAALVAVAVMVVEDLAESATNEMIAHVSTEATFRFTLVCSIS